MHPNGYGYASHFLNAPWYGTEGLILPSQGMDGIRGVFTHGGSFLQYNIFGHLFEVAAKYRPPVKPISSGAYGVVWYNNCSYSYGFSKCCI
jgi:hypothetical protein